MKRGIERKSKRKQEIQTLKEVRIFKKDTTGIRHISTHFKRYNVSKYVTKYVFTIFFKNEERYLEFARC